MKEIWKDIAGYEGSYQVSNLGRVRSLDRTQTRSDGKTYRLTGRVLKPSQTSTTGRLSSGYLYVVLGGRANHYVHRLVAAAFVTNTVGPDAQVNHLDGDKLNNAADNLAWTSAEQNTQHAVQTGLYRHGDEASWSKLTNEQVAWLRSPAADHLTNHAAALQLGVSPSTISMIRSGKRWKQAG